MDLMDSVPQIDKDEFDTMLNASMKVNTHLVSKSAAC